MSEVFDKIEQINNKIIPISQGGTGATTAEEALKNLGITNINPNLLDNWYFGNPVNQRGQISYNYAGYTIDRWKMSGDGLDLDLHDNFVTLTNSGGGVDMFETVLEQSLDPDMTYTLSVLIDGGYFLTATGNPVSGTHSCVINIWGNYNFFVYDFNRIIFQGQNNNGINNIVAVKLELGTQQTLAHQENGVWVLNEIPNYADEYAKCKQYNPFTGEYTGINFVNPNLLDNWYFGNPVNQRGITANQGISGYGLDRWIFEGDGYISEFKDDSVIYNFPAQYNGLVQKVDNYSNYAGKTITCSILVKAYTGSIALMIYDGSNHYGYNHLISAVGVHQITVTLPNNISTLWFRVELRGTEAAMLEISAAKLELGTQQTLAYQNKDGNWILNEIPNYADEYTKCKQYSPFTGEYVGLNFVNPNLLDNWYFGNPVNQRGQTTYIGAGYTFDRWLFGTDDTTATVSIASNGVVVSGAGSWNNFEQRVNPRIFDAGNTYTLSFLCVDTSKVNWTYQNVYTNSTDHWATGRYDYVDSQLITTTFTPAISGNSGDIAYIGIQAKKGETLTIIAAKLELGEQQTLVHQDSNGNWVLNEIPNYAEQMAICSQYVPNTGEYVGLTAEHVGAFHRIIEPHYAGYTTILEYLSYLSSKGIKGGSFNAMNCTDVPNYTENWGYNVFFYIGEMITVICTKSFGNTYIRMAYDSGSEWITEWRELFTTAGGTLSGDLRVVGGYGQYQANTEGAVIGACKTPNDAEGRRWFLLKHEGADAKYALVFGDSKGESYNIFGTHNVTCGTTDLTSGSSGLTTGCVYQKYE